MKEITVQELRESLNSNNSFQLIDVREPWEYDFANIKGELIPLGKILDSTEKIDKTKKVVIMCRSGKRSADAIEVLQNKYGIENLYNLKGGILAWADEIDNTIQKY